MALSSGILSQPKGPLLLLLPTAQTRSAARVAQWRSGAKRAGYARTLWVLWPVQSLAAPLVQRETNILTGDTACVVQLVSPTTRTEAFRLTSQQPYDPSNSALVDSLTSDGEDGQAGGVFDPLQMQRPRDACNIVLWPVP
jgi:hypothetical protein